MIHATCPWFLKVLNWFAAARGSFLGVYNQRPVKLYGGSAASTPGEFSRASFSRLNEQIPQSCPSRPALTFRDMGDWQSAI